VRERHGEREEKRLTAGAPGPDEIRGQHRFAMTGRERVERAEPEREEQGGEHADGVVRRRDRDR